jgi:hypothetical protein
MQSKPQDKLSPVQIPAVQTNKTEPTKQPQPLDLKALGQVAGGARSPFTQW